MKNLELKVLVNNFKEINNCLKNEGIKFFGILNQKDIYYNLNDGRLKFRIINGKDLQLIFYRRPNKKNSKFSHYQIFRFSKKEFSKIDHVLRKIFGVKSVVEKRRELWLFKHTRIHLDKVKNLGNFLELETVVKNISLFEAKKEHQEIIKLLKLNRYKKQSKSYGDLF